MHNELHRDTFASRNSILEPEDEALNFSSLAAQVGSLQLIVFNQVRVKAGARRLLMGDSLLLGSHWLLDAYNSPNRCKNVIFIVTVNFTKSKRLRIVLVSIGTAIILPHVSLLDLIKFNFPECSKTTNDKM